MELIGTEGTVGTVPIGGTKTKDSFARSHALRTDLDAFPQQDVHSG